MVVLLKSVHVYNFHEQALLVPTKEIQQTADGDRQEGVRDNATVRRLALGGEGSVYPSHKARNDGAFLLAEDLPMACWLPYSDTHFTNLLCPLPSGNEYHASPVSLSQTAACAKRATAPATPHRRREKEIVMVVFQDLTPRTRYRQRRPRYLKISDGKV